MKSIGFCIHHPASSNVPGLWFGHVFLTLSAGVPHIPVHYTVVMRQQSMHNGTWRDGLVTSIHNFIIYRTD